MDVVDPEYGHEMARVEANIETRNIIMEWQESYNRDVTVPLTQIRGDLERIMQQNSPDLEELIRTEDQCSRLVREGDNRWSSIQAQRDTLARRLFSNEVPYGHIQMFENTNLATQGFSLGRLDYQLLEYKRLLQRIANGHIHGDEAELERFRNEELRRVRFLFDTVSHGVIADYLCLEGIVRTTPSDRSNGDTLSSGAVTRCNNLIQSILQRSILFSNLSHQVLNSTVVPRYTATITSLISHHTIGYNQTGQNPELPQMIISIRGVYLLGRDNYQRYVDRVIPDAGEVERARILIAPEATRGRGRPARPQQGPRGPRGEGHVEFQIVDHYSTANFQFGVRRGNVQNVPRNKFVLYVVCNISIESVHIQRCTAVAISLPVLIINNVSQESTAAGSIAWDNEFPMSTRVQNFLHSPVEMTAANCRSLLATKFRQLTTGELENHHLDYLMRRIPREDDVIDVDGDVRYNEFNETTLGPDRRLRPIGNGRAVQYTFWDWFYETTQLLIRARLVNHWRNRRIMGYVDRETAVQMLRSCAVGTFLLRFAESSVCKLSIAVKDANGHVRMVAPFSTEDLARRSLARNIRDEPQRLRYLYQDSQNSRVPVENAFPVRLMNNEPVEDTAGYVGLFFRMSIGDDVSDNEDVDDGTTQPRQPPPPHPRPPPFFPPDNGCQNRGNPGPHADRCFGTGTFQSPVEQYQPPFNFLPQPQMPRPSTSRSPLPDNARALIENFRSDDAPPSTSRSNIPPSPSSRQTPQSSQLQGFQNPQQVQIFQLQPQDLQEQPQVRPLQVLDLPANFFQDFMELTPGTEGMEFQYQPYEEEL